MKKLGILLIIFVFAFASCKDDSISAKDKREAEQKSDWLDVPTFTDDNSSYWYVVIEKKDNGMKISSTIKQEHPHFSINEAKEYFEGNCMIVNFIRVSKATYDEQWIK